MASLETAGEVSGSIDPGNMQTVDNDCTPDMINSADSDNIHIPDLAPSVDPDEQARDFSRKSWREDLELVVEGKTLHVASNILSLLSPVFTAMFEERFQEDGPRRIELTDKKHGDVVQFLRCLYPNICQQVTEDNVFAVLPLAEEFNVEKLKHSCEEFIDRVTGGPVSARQVCRYLQLAFRHDLTGLRAKCVKLATNIDHKSLADAEKVHPLSQEAKLAVQAAQIEQLLIDKTAYEETCNILQEFLVYELSNAKRNAFSKAKPGTLKLLVSGVSTFKSSESVATTVHGISWYIDATRINNKENGDYLSICIYAEALGNWPYWECEAVATVWLLNKDSGKHRVHKFTNTFSSSETGYGWDNFISFKELNAGTQYVVEDTFEINVYFLAKEPICKPDPEYYLSAC